MRTALVLCVLGFVALASFANAKGHCKDKNRWCGYWAQRGHCKSSFLNFMKRYCQKSCKLCGGGSGGGGAALAGGSGNCGKKPRTRIVGGTEAPKGAWPWQAQVRTPSGFPFCGGTLVHQRWVVTAAHCTNGKSASSIRIRLGAHYRTSNKAGTEQDFEVEKVINHPSYKRPVGLAHDISLLKLRRPAKLNRAVNLACLPPLKKNVQDGKMCWVTGFGRLTEDGSSPDVLMQVRVPVVSQGSCKQAYGRLIHPSMICAGLKEGGKDACQGDSGGPMVCESNGRFILEGVVSWGHGCAAPGKYGVYARVRYSQIRKWLKRTMSTK